MSKYILVIVLIYTICILPFLLIEQGIDKIKDLVSILGIRG